MLWDQSKTLNYHLANHHLQRGYNLPIIMKTFKLFTLLLNNLTFFIQIQLLFSCGGIGWTWFWFNGDGEGVLGEGEI